MTFYWILLAEVATFTNGFVHGNVNKWKHFLRHWPFVWRNHRCPVNSPRKGQWRGALMFSVICAWINGWVNHREAGDLGRHRPQYGITVMCITPTVSKYFQHSMSLHLYDNGQHICLSYRCLHSLYIFGRAFILRLPDTCIPYDMIGVSGTISVRFLCLGKATWPFRNTREASNAYTTLVLECLNERSDKNNYRNSYYDTDIKHERMTISRNLANFSAISLPQQTIWTREQPNFKSLKSHINWDNRIWKDT